LTRNILHAVYIAHDMNITSTGQSRNQPPTHTIFSAH